jgi:hypothetical protein
MGKVVLVFQFLCIRVREQSVFFFSFNDKNKTCNPVFRMDDGCMSLSYSENKIG